MSVSRRAFIENGVILIAACGMCSVGWSDPALLSESDPAAAALGYKADATKVDKAKYPQYAAGQSCSNCALYQGASGAAAGLCPVFAGKQVAGAGWCASYSKKG
jgi:hypothetical protein